MGKRNNQQFVQLPHARFIDQLMYKARLVGIQVILQEESYTSKASFLDNDPLPTYQADRAEQPVFSGKRIARSWYRAKDGTVLHADINASYNILRKRSSDPRPSGARSSGRGSSPQTAGALKRMTHRHIGHHFKILLGFLPSGQRTEDLIACQTPHTAPDTAGRSRTPTALRSTLSVLGDPAAPQLSRRNLLRNSC